MRLVGRIAAAVAVVAGSLGVFTPLSHAQEVTASVCVRASVTVNGQQIVNEDRCVVVP